MSTSITNKYYPSLSTVVTLDDFPENLGFIKEGIKTIFDKIYIKDFQANISPRGESGFYGLSIVSKERLQFKIPGTEILFVLNPDKDDVSISSFPVTVEYQWLVLSYLRSFDLQNFSFSARDFFELGLQILNVSEEEVISLVINNFVTPSNESLTKVEQFVNDLNNEFGLTIPVPTSDNKPRELVLAVKNQFSNEASIAAFLLYFLDGSNIENSLNNVKNFFKALIPDDIEEYIKNIITPKARVTLALSAAIEFPQSILKPVLENGAAYPDSNAKTQFKFAQALLYADTQEGFGYQAELGGSLFPDYATIGNTGMLIQIDSLKLDLSKKTNIPEADADGRPNDFVGVYARALSVTLPARWFNDDLPQGTPASTLKLSGYDLLVGTGGISGTIMLETVYSQIGGGSVDYYDNDFDLIFPVTLLQKNVTTSVVEESVVPNITQLKEKLFPTASTNNSPITFKFPLTLTEKLPIAGVKKTFNSTAEYQTYLNSLNDSNGDAIPTLWKKIGSPEKGFRIGFNKFDITFKQNKVVGSNIKGALEIPKFKKKDDPNGDPLQIGIEGHLYDDGDFNLTASFAKGSELEASLFGVVDFKFNSIELGKEDDDFYIGTACEISFTNGIMQEMLKGQKIIIEKLRIYSDGNIELVGGDIPLPISISLNLGPVKMAVSNINFGATQINGRKYNFWGFDGAININPLGLDARGEGVKYYYCTEDGYEDSFLRIQTIEVDLMIPGTATSETALAIIHGMISLPEPGVSQEFSGEVDLKLPQAKISGGVGMKFAPKYPAFLIDAHIELPTPIPLGFISISAFRGLLGFRYVATKKAAGLTADNSWYEFYMKPQKGINIHKFSGPPDSLEYKNPFSIGAGATFGTTADGGHVLSMRAMLLLSLPTLFYIEAGLNIISSQLGLAEDDPSNPPFFAFVAFGDDSLELGAGAEFSIPKDSGEIFKLHAKLEAGFFFKNQKPWYVNLGTQKDPITARVLTILTAKSFIMLSAQGIQAGARLDFDLNKSFGPAKVHLWAYMELGGQISFKRPQMGGYMTAGGGIKIKIWIVNVEVSLDTLFSVESFKPFLIYAELQLNVRVKIGFIKVKKSFLIQLQWEFNKTIDYTPYSPIPKGTLGDGQENRTLELVKGVHMLTNESFALDYFKYVGEEGYDATKFANGEPIASAITKVIPLDTFIDIKTNKGLMPRNNTVQRIGGYTSGSSNYTLMLPPVATVKGKKLRQVAHRFSITNIALKAWTTSGWVDYDPYKAVVKPTEWDEVNDLPFASWQKTIDQYDSIRVLGTNPFAFMSAAEPGWHIPEQYGITPSKLFCVDEIIEEKWIDFSNKNIGQRYYVPTQYEADDINGIFFKLIGETAELDEGNLVAVDFMSITGEINPHGAARSLSFNNYNQLEITFPEPVAEASLSLTTHANTVRIQAYSTVIKEKINQPLNENPYELEVDKLVSFEEIVGIGGIYTKNDLTSVIYLKSESEDTLEAKFEMKKIDKIVITPIGTNTARILEIREEIAALFATTYENAIDENQGTISIAEPSNEELYNQLLAELAGYKTEGGDCYSIPEIPVAQPSFTHFYGYQGKDDYAFENVVKFGETNIVSFHPSEKTTAIFQIDAKGKLLRERLLNSVVTSMQVIDDRLVMTQALEGNQCKGIGTAIIEDDFVVGCQGMVATTAIVSLDSELNPISGMQYLDSYSLNYNKVIGIADGELLWINTRSNETRINWVGANRQIIQSVQVAAVAIKVLQSSATQFTLVTKDKKVISFSIDTVAKTITQTAANVISDATVAEIMDAVIANNKIVVTVQLQYGQFGVAQINNNDLTIVTNATVFGSALQLSNHGLEDNKIIAYNERYLFLLDDALQLTQLVERKNGVEEATILRIQNEPSANEIAMLSIKPNDKGVYFSLFGDQFDNCSLKPAVTITLISTTTTVAGLGVTFTTMSVPSTLEYQTRVRYSNLITINDTICAKGLIYEEEEDDFDCTTSIQKVGWLSKEDYIYNETIPGIDEVQADISNMKDAVQEVVQPIWRPNTTYYLHFTLEDAVETRNATVFEYYYGFKTKGPVGHYEPTIKPFLVEKDTNPDAVVNELTKLNDSPLTSLRRYIDYNRSYPNADGSLLQAKPVYYGNEQCKISLFFTQPYVYHMLKKWEEYITEDGTLPEIDGALNITIKDPLNDVFIPYPLPEVTEETGELEYPTPVVKSEDLHWLGDNDPRIPVGIKALNNLIKSGSSCTMNLGLPIKPKSKFYETTLTNLKPSKLYTVLVSNFFDADQDGAKALDGSENKLVHQFGFQTSRYKNFAEQVNSYLVEEKDEAGEVIETHQSLFDIKLNLTQVQINTLYDMVTGISNPISDAIATAYHDLFDRATSGVLKMAPLNPAQNTEFNRIIDATGKIVAILIRNPEPFNIPKMPLEEVKNTISVVYSTSDVADDSTKSLGDINVSYKVLYSKDYSQVLIMHESKEITAENLDFRFEYREWNNNDALAFEGQVALTSYVTDVPVKNINIKN